MSSGYHHPLIDGRAQNGYRFGVPTYNPEVIVTHSPYQNIMLVVFDSMRADAAPSPPYIRGRAIEFNQARAAGCWTLPSHASMFTGIYTHGCDRRSRKLSTNFPTLAELLRDNGWRTHMVTANGVTTNMPPYGLDRGFETVWKAYEHMPSMGLLDKGLILASVPRLRRMISRGNPIMDESELVASRPWFRDTTSDLFDEALRLRVIDRQRGAKSFTYLNLMDGHFPYHTTHETTLSNLLFGEGTVSTNFVDKLREIQALFRFVDEGWLKTDHMTITPDMLSVLRCRQQVAWKRLASLIDTFANTVNEAGDTLLIICSDHGDAHGEQGDAYHVQTVSDACIRVPLWILGPNLSPRTVQTPVSTVDLFHTILREAGIRPDAPSLLRDLERAQPVIWQSHFKTDVAPWHQEAEFAVEENGQRLRWKGRGSVGEWYMAPVGELGAPEPIWQLIQNENPITDMIKDVHRRQVVQENFTFFQSFSQI